MSAVEQNTPRGWFDSLRKGGAESQPAPTHSEQAARTQIQEILGNSGLFGDERATSVIFGVLPRSGTYFIEQLRGTGEMTVGRADVSDDLARELLPPIQDAKWLGELEWEFGDGGPTLYALDLEEGER